jgi:EAL domain-containing protein (putative c-di-GMP-specific phosphodiesterase class I)/GGDEF domain-containing protein
MDVGMFFDNECKKSYFKWITMENEQFLKDMLSLLIKKEIDNAELEAIGKKIYDKTISFSKLAIFLDTFSYTLSLDEKKQLRKNENILAKGYLKYRLPKEIKSLKLGINNNPNFVTKKDLAIVDELLVWLESLINSFLKGEKAPDINGRINEFIKFAEERSGIFFDDKDIKDDFLRTNKELYECAVEAVNFYEKGGYYYFVLIYIEMIALFLKMVTLLSGMFIEEELLSIYIDPITLLPNRFQLIKDINSFKNVYVMIVNIKAFSKLNMLYGYELGDGILKKVAGFLKTSVSIKNYRIYGDEFAILVDSEKNARVLFDSLNSSISVIANNEKYDIFFYGAYSKFEDKALESCEFALFRGDKKDLIASREIEDLIENIKQELTLVQKLKEIMIKDDIIPYYQPIYITHKDVKKILKYEVLMRLKYENEILEPKDFLETLTEAPFYTEFTKSILIKSFEIFKNSNFTFSVNFTLKDIKDKTIRILLETLVSKYPDVAKRLTIEIVENEALKEFELLNEFITTFKKRGISFALDDFGSGYSNFAQFAKLHIDFIKIDGTIITQVLEDKKMQQLVDSIVNFAQTLELQTIAEFVCTKELFEYLQSKVDMLQGFYIGKPEPYLL